MENMDMFEGWYVVPPTVININENGKSVKYQLSGKKIGKR